MFSVSQSSTRTWPEPACGLTLDPTPVRTRSWGRTDVGCVRSNNEDCFFADDELGLYIVCDGMGGHAGGEVASTRAIRAVVEFFREHRNRFDTTDSPDVASLEQFVADALLHSNDELCQLAEGTPHLKGMGTTMTLMFVRGEVVVIGHCGDSRAYQLTEALTQLTCDHTLEQQLIDTGMRGIEFSRFGHVLTRVLGRTDFIGADIISLRGTRGSRFLLCSDGLSQYFGAGTITSCVRGKREAVIEDLIGNAIRSGGSDNITAVIVDIQSDGESTSCNAV